MSATKRGKQKQQAEVSEEEEDFETFVRESLGQLSKGQKQIIQFKRALFNYYLINHRHSDSLKLHFFMCVCVYVLFLFPLFWIFFIVYRVYTFLFFSLLT